MVSDGWLLRRDTVELSGPMLIKERSFGLFAAAIVSCGDPDYGATSFYCGPAGECPSGYTCASMAGNMVCVREGSQTGQTGSTDAAMKPDAKPQVDAHDPVP